MKNYYDILGVDKSASEAEIKKAYRKLAAQHHPDKGGSEEKFKEINEAWETLGDSNKRAAYDNPNPFGNSGGFGGDPFSDFFSGFGGFGGRPQAKPMAHGTNIRMSYSLTFEEFFNGCKKKFKIKKKVECPECNGKGSKTGKAETCPYCHGTGRERKTVQQGFMTQIFESTCTHCGGTGTILSNPCPHCHGEGIVDGEDIIEINIPAGSINQVVAQGVGNPAPRFDGINGDLILNITLKDDPNFQMDQYGNITQTVNIDIKDALLDKYIKVKLLNNKEYTIKHNEGAVYKHFVPQLGTDYIVKCKYIFPEMNTTQKEWVKNNL